MRIEHNKLVRDNIPRIINKASKQCNTRILDENEYRLELKKKLIEESNEVLKAEDKDEITKEIADVLEVLDALKETYDISNETIETIKNNKAIKNGTFKEKIFLEYVEE